MTAQSISIFAFVLPNPQWGRQVGDQAPANTSISYSLVLSSTVQTLSPHVVTDDDEVDGLLYVPTLASSDPCVNLTRPYIVRNVTRKANLPDSHYSLIAHAPWISPTCTESFLASASADGARACLFYLSGHSADAPPQPDSLVWGLGDGGMWKTTHNFPVYAIPSFYGSQIMQQLAYYSGNLTDAPNSSLLAEQYDPRDFIRLYTAIDTTNPSNLPSLWVFLLLVMAILLLVLGCSSCLMHCIQRRRRTNLRRMIANGEVDVEALGIKRLRVPQEVLDGLPLYTYVAERQERQDTPLSNPLPIDTTDVTSPSNKSTNFVAQPMSPPATSQSLFPAFSRSSLINDQPTCSICLEDFASQQTIVRELPCGHIYHPGCIDPFLKDHSSLCALCKGKVLPQGYCPTVVSNAMVRRERLIRRMREQVTLAPEPNGNDTMTPSSPVTRQRRLNSFHRQFGAIGRNNRRQHRGSGLGTAGGMQEMTVIPDVPPVPETGSAPEVESTPGVSTRRSLSGDISESSRRRADTVLANQRTASDLEWQRIGGNSRLRRMIERVFPGL